MAAICHPFGRTRNRVLCHNLELIFQECASLYAQNISFCILSKSDSSDLTRSASATGTVQTSPRPAQILVLIKGIGSLRSYNGKIEWRNTGADHWNAEIIPVSLSHSSSCYHVIRGAAFLT